MNIPHTIVNVSLNVAFAACFIGFFFFTYAKEVEKTIVITNVEYTVNSLLGNAVELLPDTVRGLMSAKLKSTKLPNMDEADKKVEKSNLELLKLSAMVLGGLLVVVLVGTRYISMQNNINYEDAIYHNLVLLFCIGVTEFIFLKTIAENYISANPNLVMYNIVKLLSGDKTHKEANQVSH
jgi:hypothetical protein